MINYRTIYYLLEYMHEYLYIFEYLTFGNIHGLQ